MAVHDHSRDVTGILTSQQTTLGGVGGRLEVGYAFLQFVIEH
jgi:hypothetical protein